MKITVIYGCSPVELERGVVQAQSIARQISNFGHQATVVDASNITPIYQKMDQDGTVQDCILNEFWTILRDTEVIMFAFRDNVSHVPDFMQQLLLRAVKRANTESKQLPAQKLNRANSGLDELDYHAMQNYYPEKFRFNRIENLSLSQQLRESKSATERNWNSPKSIKAVARLLRLKQHQIWHYNGVNYGLVTLLRDQKNAAVELWKILQGLDSAGLAGVFRYGVPNLYKCDPSLETAGPCIG